jgi:aminoglycoside 6'-N-acetyltransferase I
MIEFRQLNIEDKHYFNEMARLLKEAFEDYHDEKETIKELETMLQEDQIIIVALKASTVIGFIGAQRQYKQTGYELHPLVVKEAYRFNGIGKALVSRLEEAVLKRGGIMLYLGTDDEDYKTSLSQVDLFEDPFTAIKTIENYKNHPYSFYLKQGYKIVGVMPDANGLRKPDIMMAKRLIPFK